MTATYILAATIHLVVLASVIFMMFYIVRTIQVAARRITMAKIRSMRTASARTAPVMKTEDKWEKYDTPTYLRVAGINTLH